MQATLLSFKVNSFLRTPTPSLESELQTERKRLRRVILDERQPYEVRNNARKDIDELRAVLPAMTEIEA